MDLDNFFSIVQINMFSICEWQKVLTYNDLKIFIKTTHFPRTASTARSPQLEDKVTQQFERASSSTRRRTNVTKEPPYTVRAVPLSCCCWQRCLMRPLRHGRDISLFGFSGSKLLNDSKCWINFWLILWNVYEKHDSSWTNERTSLGVDDPGFAVFTGCKEEKWCR